MPVLQKVKGYAAVCSSDSIVQGSEGDSLWRVKLPVKDLQLQVIGSEAVYCTGRFCSSTIVERERERERERGGGGRGGGETDRQTKRDGRTD